MLTTDIGTTPSLLELAEPLLALHDQWLMGHYREQLTEFRRLVQTAMQPFVKQPNLHASGYMLCALFDETILTQTEQDAAFWRKQPLLQVYFHEAWGGEHVFVLLDQALHTPQPQYELLCLSYVCLCLGFQGKYADQEGGVVKLMQLKQTLFSLVEQYAPNPTKISEGVTDTSEKPRCSVWAPKRVIWIATVVVLLAWLGMQVLLYQRSKEVVTQLTPLVSHVA